MSVFNTGRLILAAFISAVLMFRFIDCNRKNTDQGKDRWMPVLHPMYMVSLFVGVFAISLLLNQTDRLRNVGASLAEVMLATAVYFALLLPVLPLLRRHFSARACATLWLLPNVLYFAVYGDGRGKGPLLMLPVRARLDWLLWVWLAGAVTVFAWKIAEHVRFRRALLRDAHEPDAETLAVFQSVREEMQESSALAAPLPLLASPKTATPLSVGLMGKRLRVVLPERSYSPDELRLIFRHELIHIARQDAGTKLFLTCCAAAMWWNPLMWLAMRRCADDLELGCDEFVLLDEPEDARARYAELLLRTAGDERGFTTCLSATAEALRYRLENVLRPKKKLLGGVMLGVVTVLLVAFCGSVTVAYAPQRLDEALGVDAEALEMRHIYVYGEYKSLPEPDIAALWDALRSREVYRLAGSYAPEGTVDFYGWADGWDVAVNCTGRYVFVDARRFENGRRSKRSKDRFTGCYAFAEEPDWEALLTAAARQED